MLASTIQLYRNSFQGLSREVWLLSVVSLINRSGTMVIPFLTVYLTQQLGFSYGQAGTVMMFFGAGSVLGGYIGGRLTDKIGAYDVQFWSLFLSGGMFLLLLLTRDFYGICGTIFLVSMISDAFRPAIMASIKIFSRTENRIRSIGLVRLAVNLGFAVGPALGGFIAVRLGYDWLFILDGVTCMAAAIFLRFALPKKEAKPKTESEIAAFLNTPIVSPWKDKVFLFFLGCLFLIDVAFMQFFSTIPVYLKDHFLMNEDQIGLVIALNGTMIALIEMPLLFSLENKYHPMKTIAWGALFFAFAYFAFNIFGLWVGAAIIYSVSLTIGEMVTFPFGTTFVMGRANERNLGNYMGLYNMNFAMAFVVAPGLGFYIAEHYGFNLLWYLMGGLNLVAFGGILVLLFKKKL